MKKTESKNIPVKKIEVSRLNVRKNDIEEGLDELAQNIDEIGLLQPVVVHQQNGNYQLIIGQRRFLACKDILGWNKIPALVVPIKNETQASIISFSENIHRSDLTYRDKMAVATSLLADLGSIKKVSKSLGVSQQTVRNYLGYAGVPEDIKRMVDQGQLSAKTAMDIGTSIPDEKKALAIAKKVSETPPGGRRRKIIRIAKENPNRTPSQIDKLVAKSKFKSFTLELTPRVADALADACHDYESDPKYIGTMAIEEWLDSRGFLK